jgi:hypothetical protein
MVKNNPALFKKILLLLSFLVVFNCVVAILEILLGSRFFLPPTIHWPRIRGAFRETLGFSGFLGTVSFMTFIFLKTRVRNFLLRGILFLIILSGAFFTGSRMLTLIYIIIFSIWPFFGLVAGKMNENFIKIVKYYLLIIFILLFIFFIFKINFLQIRQISTIFDFNNDLSNLLRYDAWKHSVGYLFSGVVPFVFGTGFGVSGSSLSYFGGSIIATESYILKTFIEMGFILAFLFWLAVILFLIRALFYGLSLLRLKNIDGILYPALALSILLGVFQNLFQMSLETPSTAIWFWTLFGALLAMDLRIKPQGKIMSLPVNYGEK